MLWAPVFSFEGFYCIRNNMIQGHNVRKLMVPIEGHGNRYTFGGTFNTTAYGFFIHEKCSKPSG